MLSPPQIDTYPVDKPSQSGEDEVFRTSIPRPMGIPKSDSVGQNMTAGLDSKSELPVMLFKVQDRDIQRDSKFLIIPILMVNVKAVVVMEVLAAKMKPEFKWV